LNPQFDGVYFYPDKYIPDYLNMEWFHFTKKKYQSTEKLNNNSIGDCYYVTFIEKDRTGMPKLAETFEAIFADVKTYLENLAGSNSIGIIVRKTTKSHLWMEDYRNNIEKNVRMAKLYKIAKSIYENELKPKPEENEDA